MASFGHTGRFPARHTDWANRLRRTRGLMHAPQTAAPPGALAGAVDRKPFDDEIDVYGLTHTGKVRRDNQDHFLICALRRQMVVHQTSLPETDRLMAGPERLAFLAMVADGVGGGARGEEASRIALEAVTQYVSGTMRCYYASASADDTRVLSGAPGGCAPVRCRAEAPGRGGSRVPRDGNHAHPIPWRLAEGVSPPGGRQPLLHLPERRIEPDHPGPDHGAGADRSRRPHPRGRRGHPARSHALELPRRSADRSRRHPFRHELGYRGAAL